MLSELSSITVSQLISGLVSIVLWRVPGDPPFWKTQTREEGQSPEYFIFILAVAMPVAMKSRLRGWEMSSPYFSQPSPSHRGRGAQPWTICMAGLGAL